MKLSSAETELKLGLAPSVAKSVFSVPVLKQSRAGRPKSKRIVTTYYETPEKDLARRGLTLRVRRDNDKRIQTVKSVGESWRRRFSRSNGNGRSRAPRLIFGSSKMRQSPISSPMYPRTGWSRLS